MVHVRTLTLVSLISTRPGHRKLPELRSSCLLSDDYVPSVSVFSTTGSLSTSATVSLFSLFISLEDVSFS